MDNNDPKQQLKEEDQPQGDSKVIASDGEKLTEDPSNRKSEEQINYQPKANKRKRIWIIIGISVLLIIALVVVYLVFKPSDTKISSSTKQQSTPAAGINNVSQLKAARDKLTSVVQPISSDTKQLESLK